MQPLIQYYHDYFSNEKNDGYLLLKSSIALKVLLWKYGRCVDDGSAGLFVNLSEDKKQKYIGQAKRFYSEPEHIHIASKVAYMINLITSND